MSQVLGKPPPGDGDDDDEEDELVGLADYGDGPESSDADPDSGAEEGERLLSPPGSRPSGLPRLGGDPGQRSCRVAVGRGAGEGSGDGWRGQRGSV